MPKLPKLFIVLCIIVIFSGCNFSEGRQFHAKCYDTDNPDNMVEFDFGEWNIYYANNYADERCKSIFNKITGVYIEVKEIQGET